MQSLVNATKAWQTELSIKHTKNKLSQVTKADEPKTSSLVKPRRWNNFIVWNSKI